VAGPALVSEWLSWQPCCVSGLFLPRVRETSADRPVHLRMGQGVMTRLFCASGQAMKNPAIADGVNVLLIQVCCEALTP